MTTLRCQALELLLCRDPHAKAASTRLLGLSAHEADTDNPSARAQRLTASCGVPGRPERPHLVAPHQLSRRSLRTVDGHAALLHALAHIEFNAINLALDAVWRFADMPHAYYCDWMRVAREEAHHFQLLHDHLAAIGFAYGDFPAHNALWEMVEKTCHDVLARMALVPRTLEARGLDASPLIKAKLLGAGDARGAEILDLILRDEIGHVAIGNHWYRWVCAQRGLDPLSTYDFLAITYDAPRPRAPFNLAARRAAGFMEDELLKLSNLES